MKIGQKLYWTNVVAVLIILLSDVIPNQSSQEEDIHSPHHCWKPAIQMQWMNIEKSGE